MAPETLWLLFEFVYNGAVKFSNLTPEAVIYLYVAAKQYRLERLAYLCEFYLRELINLDNVFHVLKLSNDLKEKSVKDYAVAFALRNFTSFISNKAGIAICGLDIFQEVVSKNQDVSAQQEVPLGPAPPNHYIEQMKQMHDEMIFSDGVAKVGNDCIKFHRAVLAAHSDAMANYLLKNSNEEVPFEGVTPAAFRAMLRYVYFGATDIPTELVNFCKAFGMQELQNLAEGTIKHNITAESVLDTLATTDAVTSPSVGKAPSMTPVPPASEREKLWTEGKALYERYLHDKAAIALLRRAAEMGHAEAQCNLGYCYYYYHTHIERNWRIAVEWWRKAAEQGYADAQYQLGWCYHNGIGVAKDERMAVEWWRKAADQGHERAQNWLNRTVGGFIVRFLTGEYAKP